jgi:hypothetical protein
VPGRITLFGKLTWRMAAYIAIAVITLIAAFFPEVAGRVAQWIEPARKLIPL